MGSGETNGYVYVKLGGSFITYKDRPYSINYEALDRVVEILGRVIGRGKLILGNGGGSFAHYTVLKYRDSDPADTLVFCQNSTRRLNSILVDHLVRHGFRVASIQTSTVLFEDGDRYVFNPRPVSLALGANIVPILYGECIFSTRSVYRVVSTEEVFRVMTSYFKPQRIVLLTDVNGVYSCDPRRCGEPVLFETINRDNIDKILKALKRSTGLDATGGIYGKVRTMADLSRELGVKIYITSGFDIDSSIKAILGEGDINGTIIDLS
jgi:isopentenyl phosphate kinase